MMNIQSVLPASTLVHEAVQPNYLLDTEKKPKVPPPYPAPERIELEGKIHVETRLNYTTVNSWLGDSPATFTYFAANRTYEQTKLLFKKQDTISLSDRYIWNA